ncbi:2Fe-2S iron-sulfur cluster-binding protein [Streptomyces olivaceoviridis]|uniref:2Fe-2S iron-sulfur cluster-binding protein n=1 Tax=Streptomyces olivaceoviridis TaxID=1921 RepID=UPI0037005FB7
MTDDQHGEGTPQGGGRWDPLPQGDYDDGATAFVKLPEGGIDALLSGDSPLAAPGHGYVPPRITATHTDGTHTDGTTGTWPAPDGGGQWPDPNATPAPPHAADDRFTYQPAATQHWTFEEPAAPAAPGHDVTGQWSIPVAGGDLPDESGEFTTSSLVEQWGAAPPATLPGGAPAPWATDGTGHAYPLGGEPADAPAGAPDAYGVADGYGPEEAYGAEGTYGSQDGYGAAQAYVPEDGYGHGPAGHAEDGHAGHPEGGHAGHAEDGPAGHAEGGPAGHAEGGHVGHAEDGHRDAGHVHAGPDEGGHDGAARPDAGHAGAPDADTPGGTTAPAAPAEPAPSARESGEPGTAPEGDAHGPAEAPERPVEAPADHERPADPVTASQPATAPDAGDAEAPAAPADSTVPDTPGAPDSPPGSEAAGPEGAVDASGPDTPSEGTEAEGAAEEDAEGAAVPLPPNDDHPLASYVLRVNGTDRPVTDAWIGESLLYVLRERLGLAGAKDGCSQGECGACNVQVDGRLVASCLVPAVTAAGSEVRTVEGLAEDGRPSDVQRALARCGAVQCGFCVPGMAMTVHDLLEGNPAPTELETRQALCGNLCRCSGYRGVLEAVKEVVAEREASHAGPGTDTDEARIPHQAGPGSGGVHPSAFEAPGAFDTPRRQEAYESPDTYDTPDAYGGPDRYDAPDPYGTPPGPHDQHYGQDGGQA